jgi:type II secretory pathway pseudopilin PulG
MEALIGVVGALLGGLIAFVIARWTQSQAARSRRRVAARALLGEAEALKAAFVRARERREVLPDAAERSQQLLRSWRHHTEQLADLTLDTWRPVTTMVHALHMEIEDVRFVAGQQWYDATDAVYARMTDCLDLIVDDLEVPAR